MHARNVLISQLLHCISEQNRDESTAMKAFHCLMTHMYLHIYSETIRLYI